MASEKTTLFCASSSRAGVTAREYPRKPTWSARRQSTVTNTRERFFIDRKCDSKSDSLRVCFTDDVFAAAIMLSNLAQISEPLFQDLFFRLIEPAGFVFGYFLQQKTK